MAFRTNKTPVLQTKSASGAVASFNTALAMPLVNGEFTIQAYQEGTGDPAPDNVRNIVPFNAINITKNCETVTVQLGQDVYGAIYNSVTGGKTDNRKKIFFSDYYVEVFAPYIKSDACDALITLPSNFQSVAYNNPPINIYCDNLKYERGHTIWATVGYPNCWQFNGRQIHINIANELLGITDYTQETTTTAKQKIIEWVTANNPYFVVPINNEITQLEPTPINTLNGDNNIFCDTGDTSVTYKDLDIAKRGNFREVFRLPS